MGPPEDRSDSATIGPLSAWAAAWPPGRKPSVQSVMAERTTTSADSGHQVPVLLVEDDRYIQRSISFQLSRQGYHVTVCGDGEDGLEHALRGVYQVVILDIMLPRLDGLTACRRIRAAYPALPIIITSARGSEMDRVAGLEYGADDYLAKPFSPTELEARIRAVRRRLRAGQEAEEASQVLQRGPISLDCAKREVRARGERVLLARREFELLRLLMRNPGRVFTRDALLTQIWGHAYDGYNRSIDSHLSRLRRLFRGYGFDCIETVWGVGYRFAAPPDSPVPAPPDA